MDVTTLQEQVRQLSTIVDSWNSPQSVPEIERDLVLEKLRTLYDAVRCFEIPPTESAQAETPVEFDLGIDFALDVLSLDELQEQDPESRPEPVNESEVEPQVTPAPVIEPAPEPEPESESESNAVFTSEPFAEPQPDAELEEQGGEAEQKQESISEESEAESKSVIAPTLFGIEPDEDVLRHRQKQRVIMSLYHDEPVRSEVGVSAEHVTATTSEFSETVPVAEQVVEQEHAATAGYAAEPAEEDPFEEISILKPVGDTAPGAVLGEVMNHDVQTLADTIAPRRDVASDLRRNESIGDLRRAIGLNDRFLLVRDLFDGDGDACDAALEVLNDCESLDDCMIYIAENYVWNPNSDGAKFLMELIERKFA